MEFVPITTSRSRLALAPIDALLLTIVLLSINEPAPIETLSSIITLWPNVISLPNFTLLPII